MKTKIEKPQAPQFKVVLVDYTEWNRSNELENELLPVLEDLTRHGIAIWNLEGGVSEEHLQEVLQAAKVSKDEIVLFCVSDEVLQLAGNLTLQDERENAQNTQDTKSDNIWENVQQIESEIASIQLELSEIQAGKVSDSGKAEAARQIEKSINDTAITIENSVNGTSVTKVKPDMIVLGLEEVDYDFIYKVFQRKHHIPWTIGETDRCVIREMTIDDLDDMYELYAGEGMTDYMEPLYKDRSKEEEYTRAYIENMYRFWGYGMWLVFEKSTGSLIGRAGLEHRTIGEEQYFEMGYAIAVSHQRQGYATEVCEKIMEYAAACNLGSELYCMIQPQNKPSIALAEKLGFQYQKLSIIDGTSMLMYMKII